MPPRTSAKFCNHGIQRRFSISHAIVSGGEADMENMQVGANFRLYVMNWRMKTDEK